ncbi:glycosyltransferase family 4 protein [Oidiodendron maius Zn]|uniref:Glycosyltransferase family 4 protein n=1 Tax=Oidiodendron maius (strain Zn) TaxID=913774 RepID=A0A0C3HH28_OIDMZ|nr:glycosyltransferase family 4 protein [Oidiodendron maius Zn]
MRVLAFSDLYFPRVNEVSVSIRTLHSSIRNAGHEIFPVAPEYPYASETPLDKEECVIRIPSFPIHGDHEDRWMRSHKLRMSSIEHLEASVDLTSSVSTL